MENDKVLREVAQSETGLENFGDDSFREGLEILVNSLNNEAHLNAAGEHVLRERIVGHLKQRLQIEDWHNRYPEIAAIEINKPLIGLSLPRTGSTALSFLLVQDPNSRSLLRWEAANPCPPPSTVSGEDPRIQSDGADTYPEGMRSHTPSGDLAPAECQDLMSLDFKSQMFLAFAKIPTYANWLLDADLSSTYFYELRALQILQWGCPDKPWRLKCPTHLIYLDYLNRAFPDARFVMTHRDPTDVLASVNHVYFDIMGNFTEKADMGYIAELNLRQWSTGMQRTLAFRDRDDNDKRFYDIDFRAMHKDPVGEVRGLYGWLGEPVSEEFERGMAAWWQENTQSREPSAAKDPARYGVELEQVRPLFADYVSRIGPWTQRD